MQQVTFDQRREGDVTHLRCNETGVCYSIERVASDYVIRNSGVELTRLRNSRDMALLFVEQTARLDFLSAQGDAGAYSA